MKLSEESKAAYDSIRNGGLGFYEQDRGLIAVWGKEAVQFLDGLITNDMKTLADGQQMLAAFPNAQGRLLAVVRVLRQGDRFLFETDGATREKLFQNLFRFTYAGDFLVEDLSLKYQSFEIFGELSGLGVAQDPAKFEGVAFGGTGSSTVLIPTESADAFRESLTDAGGIVMSNETFETIRIENGVPKYGVDMDETTIVPELGLDGLISYTKGCYIGQEIIARIHFRGHVAKNLIGLVLSDPPAVAGGLTLEAELSSTDGKNAGRITSFTYSPRLGKSIALAFVRYDYLEPGTNLSAGNSTALVAKLPFMN
jgi:folate-binding protein YgfZ